MKHEIVPIIGDPFENLYQLGIKEKQSYKDLQSRVLGLLSTNEFLRYGQDILSRAKSALKKNEDTFFDQCIKAYSDGLGIASSEYMSFLSLFELAAHYGQVYPELKGFLPGCSSVFEKNAEGIIHTRLIDFPLINIFNLQPRLYYWQCEGKPSVLNYSCAGLAPIFLEAVHGNGWTVSLHHKAGTQFHQEGKSIFQITFDTMFGCQSLHEFKKDIREFQSVTKWGFYLLDNYGAVVSIDLDGPSSNIETFHLNETKQLVFNNIPIVSNASSGQENYLIFCQHRQDWLKNKIEKKHKGNFLDIITDVNDQKSKNWKHPCSTLSTVGAYLINLTKGLIQVKDGDSALVASDAIIEFSLADRNLVKVIKEKEELSPFESAWKHASLAQSSFDQGKWDEAYHHLQMAIAVCPDQTWKNIFNFYLGVWNFKFISHKRDLSLIYRDMKRLELPDILRDQWLFQCMRLEKKIGLVTTVRMESVSVHLREQFKRELEASVPVFAAWMKLIYPRMEILEVFSPHHK